MSNEGFRREGDSSWLVCDCGNELSWPDDESSEVTAHRAGWLSNVTGVICKRCLESINGSVRSKP
jgi:hypothetical protein